MGPIPEKALSIELLNARNAKYTLTSFDSGDEELDDFWQCAEFSVKSWPHIHNHLLLYHR